MSIKFTFLVHGDITLRNVYANLRGHSTGQTQSDAISPLELPKDSKLVVK